VTRTGRLPLALLFGTGGSSGLHATYGETIAMDLDVFSKVARDGGFPQGVSWFFDHAETVSDQSVDRIGELGGAISVQNRMMFQGRAFVDRYGAKGAVTAPPIKKMLARGLVVAAGTDATRVSSYKPWLSLEWLVRGRDIGGLLLCPPENRVDRETALRLYTTGGAALTGESNMKGVLKAASTATSPFCRTTFSASRRRTSPISSRSSRLLGAGSSTQLDLMSSSPHRHLRSRPRGAR
jgi:predicted amidohydrolase YtcJ